MNAYEIKCIALVQEARKWLGIREVGGNNMGPEVEMFQKAVDGVACGEAWCLAFVQFCVKQVEAWFFERYGGNPNPSLMYPTEHVMTLWNKSDKIQKQVKEIHPGLLMVWQHWKDGKATGNGHIGIVAGVKGPMLVNTIEGNTRGMAGDQRDGDGVYERERLLMPIGELRFKGWLKVWDDFTTSSGTVD